MIENSSNLPEELKGEVKWLPPLTMFKGIIRDLDEGLWMVSAEVGNIMTADIETDPLGYHWRGYLHHAAYRTPLEEYEPELRLHMKKAIDFIKEATGFDPKEIVGYQSFEYSVCSKT